MSGKDSNSANIKPGKIDKWGLLGYNFKAYRKA